MSESLRHWRAFVTVYQLGSMTEAARTLHLTQPAVSSLIRELEASINMRLFDRTRPSLQRTAAADALIASAEHMLAEVARFGIVVKSTRSGIAAQLAITIVPSIGMLIIPGVLAQFERRFPTTKVSVYENSSDEALRQVRNRRVEFAVGTFEETLDVDLEQLAEYSLLVVCKPNSPLAQGDSITWADVNRTAVVTLMPPGNMRAWIEKTFARAGEKFTPSFEVSKFTSAIEMVHQNLGCTIVPSYLGNDYAAQGLVARSVDEPPNTKPLSLMRAKGATLSAPARCIVELIRDEVHSRLTPSH
jgi:DNA-binding transcriptional LysR family regulator